MEESSWVNDDSLLSSATVHRTYLRLSCCADEVGRNYVRHFRGQNALADNHLGGGMGSYPMSVDFNLKH